MQDLDNRAHHLEKTKVSCWRADSGNGPQLWIQAIEFIWHCGWRQEQFEGVIYDTKQTKDGKQINLDNPKPILDFITRNASS